MTEVPGDQVALLRRRQLATALRRHREARGFSAGDVTHRLEISASKLSRMETGERPVSDRDLDRLCSLYELSPEQREMLFELAVESRQRSWWEHYDVRYAKYIGLEATAGSIFSYGTTVIPSLLQSPEYARAVTLGSSPHASVGVILERVEAKRIRQQILERENAPQFAAIIDESALCRVIGSHETHRASLHYLADTAERLDVSIRVIPFDAGASPGQDFQFTILSYAEAVRDVVYIEMAHGDIYLETPKELEFYRTFFARLASLALPREASLALIRKAASPA